MTALASEYKETLAIERSMENDNHTKEEWIKQQKLFKETAVSLNDDENE